MTGLFLRDSNFPFSFVFFFFFFPSFLLGGDAARDILPLKRAELTMCIYHGAGFAFLEAWCFGLTETDLFCFGFTSSRSGQSALPIRLTMLEIYYPAIQYLQMNLSEANGLFCLSLALCAMQTEGWLKPDRNIGNVVAALCFVSVSVAAWQCSCSSLLLRVSVFLIEYKQPGAVYSPCPSSQKDFPCSAGFDSSSRSPAAR